MLTSEIVIERPPNDVWAFFIAPDNWKKWSRLSLSTARWAVGGSLHFEKGMTSKIEAITPGQMVKYGDAWSEETWTFASHPSGTTVRVDETPRGIAYSDHGAAALAKTRLALEKMKAAIENTVEPESDEDETPPVENVAPPAEAPGFPRSGGMPSLVQDDDDGGPNPGLRRIPF